MKTNLEKIKYVNVTNEVPQNVIFQNVTIGTDNTDRAKELIYLDSKVNNTNHVNSEIKRRINLANRDNE